MTLRLAAVLALLSPFVALAADPAPAADGTTQPAKKKAAKKKTDGKKAPDKK